MKRVLVNSVWNDPLLYKGIADFSASSDWHVEFGLSKNQGFPIDSWKGEGIIARLANYSDQERQRVALSAIPVIDIQSRPKVLDYPLVATNIDETVQLAFDFLRYRKGFRHFAFFGSQHSLRGRTFKAFVEDEGFDCRVFHLTFHRFDRERQEIIEWLSGSEFPLAVYCDNDTSASFVTSILLDAGIAIPESVAILGTDNDELICNSSYVPISSIDTNLYQVGYKAAELLDAAMNGHPPELTSYLVSPKDVVERASTDILAVKSAMVRAAIKIMRQDYDSPLTIKDIVADLGVSQTGLERAFKRELGITPAVCLRNIRMREAAKMLRVTDEKITTVARMVGVPNSKHFATTFRKVYGIPPFQYRKKEV